MTTEESSQTMAEPRVRVRVSVPVKVWTITVLVAVGATALFGTMGSWSRLPGPVELPWWMLALLFYVGEIAVVHLRFRAQAHSFSMSEIALVLGLMFGSPAAMIVGQLVGNTAALVVNRRQPAMKLFFNLALFSLVNGLAILVFRALIDPAHPLGPRAWMATAIAALVTLVIAGGLIHMIIRVTGGHVTLRQTSEVMVLSIFGGVVNSALGFVIAVVLWSAPSAAWMGLVPPAVLYLAYRAYISQRSERSRIESIYDVTRRLHAAPEIERALLTAAESAVDMFDAERTEIVIFASEGEPSTRTRVAAGGEKIVRQELLPLEVISIERAAGRGPQVWRATPGSDRPSWVPSDVDEAMLTAVRLDRRAVGAMVVMNRVGDVSHFDARDVELLENLCGQVAVSVENDRLGHRLDDVEQQKDRLAEEVRSKDAFVASVSHELRTPLTAILGLATELREHREMFSGAEIDEVVGLIADQSSELAGIVEDLLVAARADIGSLVLKPVVFDPTNEIESVLVGHTLSHPGQHVAVEACASCSIWADPLRFRQIVRNLLTNARRYGGGQTRIEVDSNIRTGAVRVIDNGPGVPRELADAIFQPYRRAHNAVGQPDSVGLGLSVARKLARLMGGELSYYRESDETVFEIVLPSATVGSLARSVS